MNWNDHNNLVDKHAFLGASKYHWINYDKDKLIDSYNGYLAVQRGTELHALACSCIKNGVRLRDDGTTLSMYVNAAIDNSMRPEQVLYYSDVCFGTTDSIKFENGKLDIYDLKTGSIPAHMEQLEIYAALFCLEYHEKPTDISAELRIYQNNDILVYCPEAEEIQQIMGKIRTFSKTIEKMRRFE